MTTSLTPAQLAAALADADPRAAVDGLVRAELAAGRACRELVEPLCDFADGLTADDPRSTVIDDTLDALTGWCHPDCRYRDGDPTSGPAGGPAYDIRVDGETL